MSTAIRDYTQEVERWWVRGFNLPRRVRVAPSFLLDGEVCELFDTEKLAIDYARKLRVDEIDRLQAEVNALDQRYDKLEDAEMVNS